MGFALILEGILSAAYHVCPNKRNYQFGTFSANISKLSSYVTSSRYELHVRHDDAVHDEAVPKQTSHNWWACLRHLHRHYSYYLHGYVLTSRIQMFLEIEDIHNSWLYCFTIPLELGTRVSHRQPYVSTMRKRNTCPKFKRIGETIQPRVVYIFNYKMFHQEASVDTIKMTDVFLWNMLK